MANPKDVAFAGKFFKLVKNGAKFTPAQIAAARKVYSGKGTDADRQILFSSLNVEKIGAKDVKNEVRGFQKTQRQIGNYAVLASTVNAGGIAGVTAGFQIGTNLAADVGSLARNKDFRDMLEGVTKKVLGDPKYGAQAAYMTGRIADKVGGVATVIQAALAAATIGNSIGAAVAGTTNTEQRRLASSEHVLASLKDRQGANELQLANMRYKAGFNQLTGAGALPLIGDYLGERTNRQAGYGAEGLGIMETRIALQKLRPGNNVNVKELRELGRKRYFENTYGDETLGAAANWIDRTLGRSAKAENGATEEVSKSLTRSEALKAAGYEAISEGRFDKAREYMRQANMETPGTMKMWQNVESLYPMALQAAEARIMWPFSQQPRRSRTGE